MLLVQQPVFRDILLLVSSGYRGWHCSTTCVKPFNSLLKPSLPITVTNSWNQVSQTMNFPASPGKLRHSLVLQQRNAAPDFTSYRSTWRSTLGSERYFKRGDMQLWRKEKKRDLKWVEFMVLLTKNNCVIYNTGTLSVSPLIKFITIQLITLQKYKITCMLR